MEQGEENFVHAGNKFVREKNWDAAIGVYTQEIQKTEKAMAYLRRGNAYYGKGDYEAATPDYSNTDNLRHCLNDAGRYFGWQLLPQAW